MKVEDLQRALVAFGLAEAEAKAFYHLSKMGESTATEVAKQSGLSRAEVYRAADGLEAQGLIERTMSRPQRFIPKSIEEALDLLLTTRRADLNELESQRERVAQLWPKQAGPDEADEQRFKIQKGRTQIEGLFTRMLERAEREVAIAAPHRTIFKLSSWGLGRAMTQAAQRGVQVRIITQLTEDLLGQEGSLPAATAIRHSELPTYAQFLIVDQKEIAIYVTVDPVVGTTGRPETVLWLNSPDFTMGQQTLFDDMWMQSVDLEARRAELETGHRPQQLRVVRGRFPRVDEMRTIIARAQRIVRVAAPEAVAAFLTPRVLAALRRAAKKGIEVDVLAREVPDELSGLKGLRARGGAVDRRLGVLIIDDEEALVVPLGPGEAEGAEERSVVVTVPAALDVLRERYEAAWAAAT